MDKLKSKYFTQKTGAKNRGIEWHFTFEEWLAWWGDDIVKRGNKSGQLVMARTNDTGPYHPDNVRKITANENHLESYQNGLGWQKGSKHTPETLAKISAANRGKTFTPEHRANLNVSKIGVPRSEEVKAKIRATILAKRLANTS